VYFNCIARFNLQLDRIILTATLHNRINIILVIYLISRTYLKQRKKLRAFSACWHWSKHSLQHSIQAHLNTNTGCQYFLHVILIRTDRSTQQQMLPLIQQKIAIKKEHNEVLFQFTFRLKREICFIILMNCSTGIRLWGIYYTTYVYFVSPRTGVHFMLGVSTLMSPRCSMVIRVAIMLRLYAMWF
jgi:hypothetical protein